MTGRIRGSPMSLTRLSMSKPIRMAVILTRLRDCTELMRRAEDHLLTEIDRRLAGWRRDKRKMAAKSQRLEGRCGKHDVCPSPHHSAAMPKL